MRNFSGLTFRDLNASWERLGTGKGRYPHFFLVVSGLGRKKKIRLPYGTNSKLGITNKIFCQLSSYAMYYGILLIKTNVFP